ncbi:MAG: hypothetical protein R3E66_13615 [bacterium]
MDLRAYVEALEDARQKKSGDLTEGDLREIVRELGWSDEDIAKIDAEIEASSERGANFASHRLWSNSIAEYEDALRLAPTRLSILSGLASSHMGKFRETQEPEHRTKAEYYARRCLDIDPRYQTAYAIVREIGDARTRGPRAGRRLAAGVAILSVLVGAGVFVSLSDSPDTMRVPIVPPREGTPQAPQNVTPVTAPPPVKVVATPPTSPQSNIEVEFQAAEGLGLTLEMRKIEQSDYDSGSYFSYAALLKNTGNLEFSKISGRLELVGADGTNEVVHAATFLDTHEGDMRPGDVHEMQTTMKSRPGVKLARFVVTTMESRVAPERYPDLVPVNVIWDIRQPPSVKLDIFERRVKVGDRSKSILNTAYFEAEWEIRNVGSQTLKKLNLEYRLYDKSNNLLVTNSMLTVYSSLPEFLPGEKRVETAMKEIKTGEYDHYELHVIEVE